MAQPTELLYHHDATLASTRVTVTAIKPFNALEPSDRDLHKQGQDDDWVVLTTATLFHPQGGGQPSDTGSMQSADGARFDVHMVRVSATSSAQVLHFGRFSDLPPSSTSPPLFAPSQEVTQILDVEKRLLYSRYHTAGHVLGAAVKHAVARDVPNFTETKASHDPQSAACEFQGLIEGKWKDAIQAKVDEFVDADLAVEIEWWDEADFQANGLEGLTPDREAMGLGEEEKFRVVRIVGAETYPCGGTHVPSTKLCGKTTVKKISRSKGTSRVGYHL